MSVSHKKINRLIEEVIQKRVSLEMSNDEINIDKGDFIDLCKKIYLIESSVGSLSQSHIIDEIRTDIILAATKLSGER